jgi:penicillin amidase
MPHLFSLVEVCQVVFHDELPEAYWPEGHDRWMVVMGQLLQQPENPWWDEQSTEAVEQRDDILRQSFEEAIATLSDRFGPHPRRWRWGDLHQVPFVHQSLGKSGIPPLEAVFNRGPIPVSGGRAIINAHVWDADQSFTVTAIPSLRMVVDFSDLGDSVMVHATGQSGHAFHPHYADQMVLWQRLDYHPMLWHPAEVADQAAATLTLVPGPDGDVGGRGVLGVGCWVLGVRCWVLGVGCWSPKQFLKSETPNFEPRTP